jgi:hypothetical protein
MLSLPFHLLMLSLWHFLSLAPVSLHAARSQIGNWTLNSQLPLSISPRSHAANPHRPKWRPLYDACILWPIDAHSQPILSASRPGVKPRLPQAFFSSFSSPPSLPQFSSSSLNSMHLLHTQGQGEGRLLLPGGAGRGEIIVLLPGLLEEEVYFHRAIGRVLCKPSGCQPNTAGGKRCS